MRAAAGPNVSSPMERDLYEGCEGTDVLEIQGDLIAEGYLGPSEATG